MLAAGWFLVALFLGETGLLGALPGPAPQIALWSITGLLTGIVIFSKGVRRWVMALPMQALLAVHLSRWVGIYFLYLYERGELPRGFAVPAGWGDIVAAAGALLLILLPRLLEKRWVLLGWNTLALGDILFVLSSGLRLSGADRYLVLEQLTSLPLSFLPLMVVPLILVTHLLIYVRAWRAEPIGGRGVEAGYARSRPLSM